MVFVILSVGQEDSLGFKERYYVSCVLIVLKSIQEYTSEDGNCLVDFVCFFQRSGVV